MLKIDVTKLTKLDVRLWQAVIAGIFAIIVALIYTGKIPPNPDQASCDFEKIVDVTSGTDGSFRFEFDLKKAEASQYDSKDNLYWTGTPIAACTGDKVLMYAEGRLVQQGKIRNCYFEGNMSGHSDNAVYGKYACTTDTPNIMRLTKWNGQLTK